ncbi:cell division protein ZapB [Candidatus Poribacteria bacterium]|nr:cell division protein ZapB [Candidatus Poribacteria bacterium]
MADEGMELLQKKVQQAVTLIEKLREENNNLKDQIAEMEELIQEMKQEVELMKSERSTIKGKIDNAVSMLDKVDVDNMLEDMAKEVKAETDNPESNKNSEK